MNLKNKLYETTKKYYLIESLTSDESCIRFKPKAYHGTISQYYKKRSDMPLVTYAGKAVATLNFLLKKAEIALIAYRKEEHTSNRNDLMLSHWSNRVTQYKKAIEDLKAYGFYELVGVVEIGHDGKMFSTTQREFLIVDYKTASKTQTDIDGITFKEVSRADYEQELMEEDSDDDDDFGDMPLLMLIYALFAANIAATFLALKAISPAEAIEAMLALTTLVLISIFVIVDCIE